MEYFSCQIYKTNEPVMYQSINDDPELYLTCLTAKVFDFKNGNVTKTSKRIKAKPLEPR